MKKDRSTIRLLSLAVFVGTIAFGGFRYHSHLEYVAMHIMPAGLYEFRVTDSPPICGRWKDHMPHHRDPETYGTYLKARNFWRSKKEYEFTHIELQEILKAVMKAAEKGDWGAKALLAHFHLNGLGHLDTNKVLDSDPDKSVAIARQAIEAGQAWGYYDLGVAHEYGYGGAAMDEAISWAYYRRAAELGSPEAQMALAEAYESAHRKEEALYLRTCAYRQEHGPAATYLGRIAKLGRDFPTALRYFQDGVRFGNVESAATLMLFFDQENWDSLKEAELNKLRDAGLKPDAERKVRYAEILDALELNPDLRFKLLDNVLPLPPAELPPWKGEKDAIEPERDAPPTY